MDKLLACALILVFAASGCFWPFAVRKQAVFSPVARDVTSVEVLGALPSQGVQKVYFEPFSAGTAAAAGDLLDRLALMMVKGFSDGLTLGGRFVLVSAEEADEADLVVKGRIEEIRRRGYFRKTVFIKVRADISLSSNQEVRALVYAERKFKDKRKNSDQAAYDIGFVAARKLSE